MSSEALEEIRNAIAAAQTVGTPQEECGTRSGSVEESVPTTKVLGEIITCNACQAYLDGYIKAPETGFCPICGTHVPTMKKQQERKARLIRHYEDGGVV